ncbi:hypothetical protein BDN67DRAFT_964747 [Paxillus ammoniavirescens]|nr:hypothetical protein BDN67DRAFT_964747 [Paxillus ammoniavirescens]
MIHGRVIGNELRDVPPERLPVWGQRWFRPGRALGPSQYSMHTFYVTGMTEAAPVSTQFEPTLTEEDDEDDEDSSSSYLPSPFLFSPSYAQTHSTELTPSSSDSSSLRIHNPSVHRFESAPTTPTPLGRASHNLHPNSVHLLASQNAAHSSAMFLPMSHPDHLGTTCNVSGSLMPPPALHSAPPVHGSHVSPRHDRTPGHINFHSTNMQHLSNTSYGNHLPSGQFQLQQLLPPPRASPHITTAHGQQSAQFSQSNPSPHYASDHFISLLQVNQAVPLPTPMTSTSHNFTFALPQQNFGSGSSWNNHANMLAIEQRPNQVSIRHTPPENTTPGWPSGFTADYPTFPEVVPTRPIGLYPPAPDDFWSMSSECYRNPSPLEEPLVTFAHSRIERSALFDSMQSYDRSGGSRPAG